jgi:predicted  nucleic acid-binding Zn-ribbon protein
MDILLIILAVALGFVIGWRVNEHIHQSILTDILKRAGVTAEDLEKALDKLSTEIDETPDSTTKVYVKVERVNDQIFMFRKDTNEFLAQGTTAQDLLDSLTKRFKDMEFTITKEDGAELLKENPTS